MKKLSIILFVLYLLCSSNVNATDSECFGRNKTPWQKMLIVLNNYGVDTVGIEVVDFMPENNLENIVFDFAKKCHVRVSRKWIRENISYYTYIGDAISEVMEKKYKHRKGEKYDYYKTCYSTSSYSYDEFIKKYPNSKHIEELTRKKLCVNAHYAWYCAKDEKGADWAYQFQDGRECPYEGFSHTADTNRIYCEMYEEWHRLYWEYLKDDDFDCSRFDTFMAKYNQFAKVYEMDAANKASYCRDNQAWRMAKETNTIDAYRDYLGKYPYGFHAYETNKKIKDYEDWLDAREADNHAAYAAYCENHPFGDSIGVARMLMHRMEESDWQRVKDSKNWLDLQALLDRYPGGYYSDSATAAINALFATSETNMNDVFYSIGGCSVTDTGVVCIANTSIKEYNLRFTFTHRGRTVMQKNLRSGESYQFKLKNGSYHVVVDNPDNIPFKGFSDPYAIHGDMTISSKVYRFDYYSYPNSAKSLDKSKLESLYSDRKAVDRAWSAMYAYLEKNKITVWRNTNECIKDHVFFLYTDGYSVSSQHKDVFLTGDALKENKKVFADEYMTEEDLRILCEYRIPVRVVMFNPATQKNDVLEYSVAELKRLKAKK